MVFRGEVRDVVVEANETTMLLLLESHDGQAAWVAPFKTDEPFEVGERVVYWPCWRVYREPDVMQMELVNLVRVVRERDLSPAEQEEVAAEIERIKAGEEIKRRYHADVIASMRRKLEG